MPTEPFKYSAVTNKSVVFPPSAVIQKDVEYNLGILLGKPSEEVSNIVVVGAWHGDEVKSFLRFPNAKVFCFEPQTDNFSYLTKMFRGQSRVVCFPYACGAEDSRLPFYDSASAGNGSLLSINESSPTETKAKYPVEVRRLDGINELRGLKIDLLWADVQGYELEVLKGATDLLKNCQALFLEVSEHPHSYDGAVKYSDIQKFLSVYGFVAAAEGIDDEEEGGNALFLRAPLDGAADLFKNIPDRVLAYLEKLNTKNKLSQVFLWKILPEKFKIFLKRKLLAKMGL